MRWIFDRKIDQIIYTNIDDIKSFLSSKIYATIVSAIIALHYC